MSFVFPPRKTTSPRPPTLLMHGMRIRVVRSFKGPGGNTTHIGDDPPDEAEVGDLWYCTKADDLTLYVYVNELDEWAASSPPVSLDGLEDETHALKLQVDHIAKNMTPYEVFQDLYGHMKSWLSRWRSGRADRREPPALLTTADRTEPPGDHAVQEEIEQLLSLERGCWNCPFKERQGW